MTPDTEKMIAEVVNYAENNKWTYHKILALKAGEIPPPGDDPRYVVHIHDGYRVVYTVEQHKKDCYKHLSVSVEKEGKYPHDAAVSIILEAFGMDPDYSKSLVYMEEDVGAISIVQKF